MSVYSLLHPNKPIDKDIAPQKFFEERSIQQIMLNQKNNLIQDRKYYKSVENFTSSPNYLYYQTNIFSIYNDSVILYELTKIFLNPKLTPGRTVGGKEHVFLSLYNEEQPDNIFFDEQFEYLLEELNDDSYFKKKKEGDKKISYFLRSILFYYHHLYYNYWNEIIASNLETYFTLSLRMLCTFGFINKFLDRIDLDPFQQLSPILQKN